MTMSPKTLLTITAVSILMAGASATVAQEAEQAVPAPEEAVAAETLETVETLEAPTVEIFTREAAPETTTTVVEEAQPVVDANKIDASSETVIPAEEIAPEAVEEVVEEAVEEIVQPEE